jgi:hypothetical protein
MMLSKQSSEHFYENTINAIKLCILILFALLFHYNQLSFITEWLSSGSLHLKNQAYLDSARALAATDLAYIGELSAVTEVARSSEVGVSFFASFNVEVGNLLHTLANILDRGMAVLLASLAAIELLVLADDIAHWLSPVLFEVNVYLAIGFYLAKILGLSNILVDKIMHFGQLSLGLFLIAHLALPYGIHLSAVVGQELSQSKRQDIAQTLKDTHHELVPINKRQDLKTHAESSLQHLKVLHKKHLNHKISNLSKYLFSSVALNIFDLLLMPVLLLWLLSRLLINLIVVNYS